MRCTSCKKWFRLTQEGCELNNKAFCGSCARQDNKRFAKEQQSVLFQATARQGLRSFFKKIYNFLA